MKCQPLLTLTVAACSTALLARCAPAVQADTAGGIDWESFLRRHDIVWETLPQRFDHGAFHGNGLLGCMIHRDGPRRLRWECGRSDVTAHRRDKNRLPIGGMVLETAGEIEDGTIRLDLRNAESTGDIRTSAGTIRFRSFIHAVEMFTVVEITTTGGEADAAFTWLAAPAVDRVNKKRFRDDPPNPPSRRDTDGAVSLCVQPRHAGGAYATAWKEVDCGSNTRRLFISIADTFPGDGAGAAAAQAVRKAAGTDFDRLVKSHRDWWHAYYPLLRDSVNVYRHLLKKGDDGKLHLPVLHSPEYGNMADNNYNLSLLRWACRTLIALCERYGIDEPLVPRWKHILANLARAGATVSGYSPPCPRRGKTRCLKTSGPRARSWSPPRGATAGPAG